MKKRFLPLTAILTLFGAMFGLSSAANAALIISDGSEGLNPVGSTNEVLEGQWLGIFGGQLSTDEAGWFEFEFIGFEAGYKNWFQIDTGSGYTTIFDTESVGPSNRVGTVTNPIGFKVTAYFGRGLLDFQFVVNNGRGTVANGANPDDSLSFDGINFFMSMTDSLQRNGDSVYLFLDDAGAGPDDNHDDMVVSVTRVPEPNTLALFGLALIGLAIIWRFRSR